MNRNKNKPAAKSSAKSKRNKQAVTSEMPTSSGVSLQQAEVEKNMGNSYFRSGQYGKALGYYNNAIALNAAEAIYYGNRAQVLLKLCRYAEAVAECDNALRLDPKFAKAYYRRSLANKGLKRWEHALVDMKKVLELEPSNSLARTQANALELCIEYCKRNRKEANKDNAEGSESGDKGPSSEVVEIYPIEKRPLEVRSKTELREIPVQVDTSNSNGNNSLVDTPEGLPLTNAPVELITNEPDRVSPEDETTSTIMIPDDSEVFRKEAEVKRNLGDSSFKSGKYREALDHYDDAIALNPTEAVYYHSRAEVLLKLFRYPEAVAECDNALRLDSNLVKAYYCRALANKTLKRWEHALADMTKVTALEPSNALARTQAKALKLCTIYSKSKSNTKHTQDNQGMDRVGHDVIEIFPIEQRPLDVRSTTELREVPVREEDSSSTSLSSTKTNPQEGQSRPRVIHCSPWNWP